MHMKIIFDNVFTSSKFCHIFVCCFLQSWAPVHWWAFGGCLGHSALLCLPASSTPSPSYPVDCPPPTSAKTDMKETRHINGQLSALFVKWLALYSTTFWKVRHILQHSSSGSLLKSHPSLNYITTTSVSLCAQIQTVEITALGWKCSGFVGHLADVNTS